MEVYSYGFIIFLSRESGCGESTHLKSNRFRRSPLAAALTAYSLSVMVKIQESVSLAPFSSFRIGGRARYFFEAKNLEEIKEAVAWTRTEKQSIFVLGGGTNLLIDDGGFDGLVLKPSLNFLETHNEEVGVGAGVLVSDFLEFCIARGLSGWEWAGGLPGTLGGAVRGNAGAFRGETKDSVLVVESLDIFTLEQKQRSNEECNFAYRSSVFKKLGDKEIIISAELKLKSGDASKIREATQAKITYRKERHPLEYPNIGSIFKNVPIRNIPAERQREFLHVVKTDPFPVIPTAYLISEAGLKGVREGEAMISPKHPNFIVNMGGAKALEVKILILRIKETVKNKFGIDLEEEVQIVPASDASS